MKARIDENGCLIVTPETPIEAYALQKWCLDSPAIYPHAKHDTPRTPEGSGTILIKMEVSRAD